jgi:hypothetical protein
MKELVAIKELSVEGLSQQDTEAKLSVRACACVCVCGCVFR